LRSLLKEPRKEKRNEHPRPAARPPAGRQDGPGHGPYLDTTGLTHDTGFAPTFDVATAVADYLAWRADNPH
jgi:hypothetical protein